MMKLFDLRSALAIAPVYRRFQQLVCGNHYARFVHEYLRPAAGQRILDIGCGPAAILSHLPDVEYTGVDLSPTYIESARRRYGDRGQFHCRHVYEASLGDLGTFDLVIAHGILHHLDDADALHLFKLAGSALRREGRLVTLDGCFVEGQSPAARRLLAMDRGRFVRDKRGYLQLAQKYFAHVSVDIRHDLIRIPYTHIILQCHAASAAACDTSTGSHAA
jgi:SAM-dependent methyltransferase